jgi:hypothetical protein
MQNSILHLQNTNNHLIQSVQNNSSSIINTSDVVTYLSQTNYTIDNSHLQDGLYKILIKTNSNAINPFINIPPNNIFCMITVGNYIYIGGCFHSIIDINGILHKNINNIAQYNITTGVWSPLGTSSSNGTMVQYIV